MPDRAIGIERGQFNLLRAATDVVNDSRLRILGGNIRRNGNDDADVRLLGFEQTPGEDVAGRNGFREGAAWRRRGGSPEAGAGTLEVGLEVKDPAMVDVGVSSLRSPDAPRRIGIKMADHVEVDKLLKVEAEGVSARTDDDIGANPGGTGNVAIGI